MSDRPVVALCSGKDCSKRAECDALAAELGSACTVVDVKCVGICSGPVVVAPGRRGPHVFSKVRSKKQRRALLSLVLDADRPPSTLSKREVRGGKRKSTIRKVERRLGRTA